MANISLGPGPVVIPLSDWAEESISAIYKASSQSEFSSAFDAFVSEDPEITVNDKQISRAQYKALLQGERALEQSASVAFLGVVEAGSVGVFYRATIYERIKVGGASQTATVNSSLNIVYVFDGSPRGDVN
ncbi:uncharacterized protein B0H18DRAFT_880058 [Fomitopsis serialis]|uniref:uncharacterized protein n=1 Tax=Fomitopsis serialis TaxID=139415 RepID=UPI002008549E|nr:uncharacterized protein B0H18DRAFT_880058 [Neoantrodia serialis]KAH9921647.1 hypothetical protein B0H18DRAFT_880058 [Neoantrodia serialis]